MATTEETTDVPLSGSPEEPPVLPSSDADSPPGVTAAEESNEAPSEPNATKKNDEEKPVPPVVPGLSEMLDEWHIAGTPEEKQLFLLPGVFCFCVCVCAMRTVFQCYSLSCYSDMVQAQVCLSLCLCVLCVCVCFTCVCVCVHPFSVCVVTVCVCALVVRLVKSTRAHNRTGHLIWVHQNPRTGGNT